MLILLLLLLLLLGLLKVNQVPAVTVFGCQVDQLLEAGADLLAPVAVGPQRQIGTAVDYAHYVYSQASTAVSHQLLSVA